MLFVLFKDLEPHLIFEQDVVLGRSAVVDDRLDSSFKCVGKIFYFFFGDEDLFGRMLIMISHPSFIHSFFWGM